MFSFVQNLEKNAIDESSRVEKTSSEPFLHAQEANNHLAVKFWPQKENFQIIQ